jgi:hypothetical protein
MVSGNGDIHSSYICIVPNLWFKKRKRLHIATSLGRKTDGFNTDVEKSLMPFRGD